MIRYVPGERNEIVDLMARLPEDKKKEMKWNVDEISWRKVWLLARNVCNCVV